MDKILEIFKKVTDINIFYMLIIFLLMIDCYAITFFNIGIFHIDFNNIYNFNNIIHITILIIIFGIIFFWLSTLVHSIFYKIWANTFFKRVNKPDYYSIYKLKKHAIETNNSVLMDYIKTEENVILKKIKSRKIIYSLLIIIIVNGLEKNSIVRTILRYLICDVDLKIKIFSWIIFLFFSGIILYTIYYSVQIEDNEKIYYKK